MTAPVDMVLHCPRCGLQHIDAPDLCPECPGGRCTCTVQREKWTNPSHRSHLCHGCGHIWRPADVPTNGVAAIKTRGTNDSPIASPTDSPTRPKRHNPKGNTMLTPNNTMPLVITDDEGVERRLHALDFNPDEERQPFSRLTAYIYATDIKDAERQAVHMRYPNPPFPTVTALG